MSVQLFLLFLFLCDHSHTIYLGRQKRMQGEHQWFGTAAKIQLLQITAHWLFVRLIFHDLKKSLNVLVLFSFFSFFTWLFLKFCYRNKFLKGFLNHYFGDFLRFFRVLGVSKYFFSGIFGSWESLVFQYVVWEYCEILKGLLRVFH